MLDYWEPDEFETPAQEPCGAISDHDRENLAGNITNEPAQSDPTGLTGLAGPTGPTGVDPAELPVCCGTGCAVCVLDYPEHFSERKAESDMLAMLEAIEHAQWQAQRMVADQNEEL